MLHYLRTAFQVEKKRDEDVNARSLEDPPAVDPGSNEEGTEDEPEQPRLAHKISVEILPDLLIEETTEKPNVIDDVDALSGNVFDDMALTAKTADSVNSGIGHQTSTNDSAYTVHSNSADSVSVDNIPRLNDSDSVQTNSQPTCELQEDVCTQISSSVDESFGESVYVNVDSVVTDSGASNIKKISTCRDQTGDNDAIVSSVTDVNVTDNSKASLTSTNLVSNSDFQCTIMTLTRLAKGVLWDVQAKHYALKETLGYIHNAISKLLLDQKEKSTNEDVSSRKSPPRTSSTSAADPICQRCFHRDLHESITFDDNLTTDLLNNPINLLDSRKNGLYTCSDSQHVHDQTDQDPDLAARGNFNRSTSCPEHSHPVVRPKKKVFWQDQHPESQFHESERKPVRIISPQKYINVPDEWYNMAGDQKYILPYITMAILREEEEFVSAELSRVQDSGLVCILKKHLYPH